MKSWWMVLCCGLCMTACSGGSVDFEGGNGISVTLPQPVAPTVAAPTPMPVPSPAPLVEPTVGDGNLPPEPEPLPPPPLSPPPDPPPPAPPPVPCNMAWTLGELPTDADLPSPVFQLDFNNADELFESGNGVTIYDENYQKVDKPGAFDALGDFVGGRDGRALLLKHGYLALDPKKVFALKGGGGSTPLEAGSMALWIGTNTFQAANGKTAELVHSDDATGQGWIFNVDIQSKQLRYFAEQKATKNAQGQNVVEYSIATPITEWAAGAWHHVVITWKRLEQNSVQYRLYVDGRLINTDISKNFPTGKELPKQLYLLSTHRWSGHAADGRFFIDAFRTYDAALSHDHIVTLYRAHLDHDGPSLTAGLLQMQLLGTADGYGLAGLRDSANAVEKTMRAPSRQLWQLQLRTVANPKITFVLNNDATGHANHSCTFDASHNLMTLQWRDIALPTIANGNPADRIHVTMTLTADPAEHEIAAQLHVDNATTGWTLVKTVFPRFGGLGPIKDKPENTVLIRTGPNIGSLRRDPFHTNIWKGADKYDQPLPTWQMAMEYPGTEVPMPWVALQDAVDPTGGLYVGVHDPTWSIKTLQINHVVSTANLAQFITDHGLDIAFATSVPGVGIAGNDASPATAVLRLQDGSWFDMAMRYRRFLQTQAQMAGGTLAERMDAKTIAPAPLDAGVFQSGSMYGGPLKNLFDEISAQKGPLGLVWWSLNLWQEGSNYTAIGYDQDGDGKADTYQAQMNNFPFAKPVQPAFTKNIGEGKKQQSVITPYFSPISWDAIYDNGTNAITSTNDWDKNKGAALGIVHTDGLIENQAALGNLASSFPAPSQVHVRMCPRAPQWQQIVVNAVAALKSSAALQGFYFDEVARKRPTLCFGEGPTHNHTPGDPTYYVEGFRSILSTVRAQSGAITASEGFSDPYFDLLDGNLIEYLPWFEELVPITIATTHDYTQFVAWRTNVASEPLATMIAKQGQLFTWGGMPGGLLGSSPFTLKPLQTYVARLGILRQRWRPYLVLGTMGRPVTLQKTANPAPNNPTAVAPQIGSAIPLNTLTAYIATPGTFQLPKITTSTWTATNGTVGIVVTSLEPSLGGASHVIYVPVDRDALGLSGPSSKIVVKSWNTAETPLSWNGPGGVQLTVAPQQTYLIEIE